MEIIPQTHCHISLWSSASPQEGDAVILDKNSPYLSLLTGVIIPGRPAPRCQWDLPCSGLLLNLTHSARGHKCMSRLGKFSPKVQCQNRARVTLKIKSQICSVFQGLAVCLLFWLSIFLFPCLSFSIYWLRAYCEPGPVAGVQWGTKYTMGSPNWDWNHTRTRAWYL